MIRLVWHFYYALILVIKLPALALAYCEEGCDISGIDLNKGGGIKSVFYNNGGYVSLQNDGTVLSWGQYPDVPPIAQLYLKLIETSVEP